MELSLTLTPNPSSTSLSHFNKLCEFHQRKKRVTFLDSSRVVSLRCIKASAERTGDTIDDRGETRTGFTTPAAMEVTTTFNRGFNDASAADFPVWEKIGAVVRLSYGIGIYGAMAVAGSFICSITGIDSLGGFHLSLDAILEGLGYAVPPIMALLFILDDEVVKLSPHARAIRDVEDEELWSFFYGMSPLQFILMVAASSVGEELFYRAAVQGALADIFLRGSDLIQDVRGMASLSGVLPPFVPFAQALAAVLTAILTGSLYYVAASPKDPTYIVAPVLQSPSSRQDLKKLFEAWYEKRQMKKIYSPLLEGLLALYLGFEWIQTDNILSPIITHGIYSTVILGHGLWKIHDHKRRLRQRIQKLISEEKNFN
ncbi:uncharacterized protein LOC123907826 [Trifolium pratense]|uniref:uncharacterized protein LOC123907826 n=1 Tax=Trifolium pratense TaxID=57577 RepID=UPI001E69812B|nr:uncharacterized protein LOC123907826 [Trifolium pratense]